MVFGLKTKVKCPKCKKTFEYVFIPGGSLSSMRLGRYRYMQCPRCKRYAHFDLLTNLDKETRMHISIAQFISGVALAALGFVSFLLSNMYESASMAFLAFRLLSIISIILGVIILIGLYIYRESD